MTAARNSQDLAGALGEVLPEDGDRATASARLASPRQAPWPSPERRAEAAERRTLTALALSLAVTLVGNRLRRFGRDRLAALPPADEDAEH